MTGNGVPGSAVVRGVTRAWTFRSGVAGTSTPAGGDLVARVLAARGLEGAEATAFLEPSLHQLHDPASLPGVERAASRLLEAARGGERIVIYGDYDVDGITATAILYHALRAIAPDCDVATYVPHRIEEGYGLNAEALARMAAADASVVVSVDCGITALEPARIARRAGLDLIITDHHALTGDGMLPEAVALVHPALPGSTYPYPHLSGAGVAYKLAWRLMTMAAGSARVPATQRRLLLDLLAFAALGTVADVVPMTGENRVLVRWGLARVGQSPFAGLQALVEASGLADRAVETDHVGYILGPRLNAAGRLGHARDAVELFTTATGPRAVEIARLLTRMNDQRRASEQRMTEQACELAMARGMTGADRRAIVLSHEQWHAGIVGIVCSRLVERFCRPVVLLQRRKGYCQGSGRSVPGFALHEALSRCDAYLERYGGHEMAAGLALRASQEDAFTEAFIAQANQALTPMDLVPRLVVDCDARLEELTTEAAAALERLAPFGVENPRPRVRVRGVRVASGPVPVGQRGRHFAFTVERGGRALRVVAWDGAAFAGALVRGATIDAVVSPRVHAWNGRSTVEGELHDAALSASSD